MKTSLPTWVYFAFLIAAAIAYYFAGKLILLIAAVVLLVPGWLLLTFRFPLTMIFVNSFIGAVLSGGRRRRR